MKKSRLNWTVKRFNKEITNNAVSFDYPIQRAGGQWDDEKVSLLIHSIACDFPVPPLYALAQKEIVGSKEKEILYILDGKQRLTSLRSFIQNEFRLSESTPIFNVEGQKYNLTKHKFDELPEVIKDAVLEFTLDILKIEDALDEEIEDMFFRLNNGVSLSAQQKAKAKLGAEMALKLKTAIEHPLLTKNAVFTELQKKQAHDEVALVQAMMLIDKDFQVGKFGTKEVFEYTASLRDDKDYVLVELLKALDFLHEVLGEHKEKTLLKKINFPFVVYASHEALEKGLSVHTFKFFIESFKEKLLSKENGVMLDGKENENAWLYKMGCGAGATKAEKVSDRLTATKHELNDLYKEIEEEEKVEKERLVLLQQKRLEEQAKKDAKPTTVKNTPANAKVNNGGASQKNAVVAEKPLEGSQKVVTDAEAKDGQKN